MGYLLSLARNSSVFSLSRKKNRKMKFAVVLIILAINLKFSGASKIWPKAQELRKAHQDMLLRTRDQMPQAAEGVDAGNAIHNLLWSKNSKFRDPDDKFRDPNDKGPLPNPYWRNDKGPLPVGCVRGCPKIISPVCGSNGKTYGNMCSFEIAACLAKKKGLLLTSVKGSCKEAVKREEKAEAAAEEEESKIGRMD